MISTKEYLTLVKKECANMVSEEHSVLEDYLEVIQVWYCKTIQNHKGLFIIENKTNDMIYPYFIEATYNGNKDEMYFDFYRKEFKRTLVNCEREFE